MIAHEYPGPLTDLLAYGAATAIAASRVMGKEHYPSDVVVASAIGWLVGREVYRRHHDPDLGGGGWESLEGSEEEGSDPKNMGSPFVPLDSWVYPALDRLAALGYVSTSYEGMKPWTRIECAHLVESNNTLRTNLGCSKASEISPQISTRSTREPFRSAVRRSPMVIISGKPLRTILAGRSNAAPTVKWEVPSAPLRGR